MTWSDPVDNYCERTDPSFWAEPLNAVSNAAFIIAAAAAFLRWRRAGAGDTPVLLLVLVTLSVGLGSFAFHTLATRGAQLLDVVPIAVFIYGYLLLALRRFLVLPLAISIVVLLGFFFLSYLVTSTWPRALNGSVGYLPALFALLSVGLRAEHHRGALLAAAGVFAVSLAFRTIDDAICAALPIGTHFVWHSLNGLLLYMLLRAGIDAKPRAGRVEARAAG